MQSSNLSEAEVIELVNRLRSQPREAEWLEFKSNFEDPEVIGQYVSALANAATLCGEERAYLVWGVHDKTHEIIGTSVDLRELKKGNQNFLLWMEAGLTPSPSRVIHTAEHEGKRVVVLEINAASHTPVQFRGTEYVRYETHKKELSKHPELARQIWANLNTTPFEYREATSGLGVDEALALIDYETYFTLQDMPVPSTQASLVAALTSDRILIKQPTGRVAITNLGALLFAKRMKDFSHLERKAARVIKYRGETKLVAEREHEGTRGYASGFEGMVSYIDNLLPRSEVIEEALRASVAMYPPKAIREIVANALIHQDFSISGSGPMIELYDDRIEISNPGTPLVDPARFVDAPPRSRNEKLAQMMRRCRLCEERGSGWDRVGFEIELHQLPAPSIRVTQGHTSVTLFSPRPLTRMDREDRIRALYLHSCLKFVSHQPMTNSTVRDRFGIEPRNSATASRYINEAVTAGVIAPYDPNAAKSQMRYLPFWAASETETI